MIEFGIYFEASKIFSNFMVFGQLLNKNYIRFVVEKHL